MIKPGDIHIKDTKVLRGLMERRFAPLLITIILEVAVNFGIMITESYRDKLHMNDLHGTQPVRAIDLRFWDYGADHIAYEIANWINSRWQYDPARPDMVVALVHDSGEGIHFHIQVHDNTVLRRYA